MSPHILNLRSDCHKHFYCSYSFFGQYNSCLAAVVGLIKKFLIWNVLGYQAHLQAITCKIYCTVFLANYNTFCIYINFSKWNFILVNFNVI